MNIEPIHNESDYLAARKQVSALVGKMLSKLAENKPISVNPFLQDTSIPANPQLKSVRLAANSPVA